MRKLIYTILILCLMIPLVPIKANAITLGEYEAKLNKYKKTIDNRTKLWVTKIKLLRYLILDNISKK